MTQAKIDLLLNVHNLARTQVSPLSDRMLKMVGNFALMNHHDTTNFKVFCFLKSWDYDLEAKTWPLVEKCVFQASPESDRETAVFLHNGENLWVGWGQKVEKFSPGDVVSYSRRPKGFIILITF